VEPGVDPTFELTLFDGTATANVAPTGAILDSAQIDGTATTLTDRYAFDWTNHLVTLSTTGNSTGTVTLQIDLLDGGYASFDNLTIASSEQPGNVTPVPALPGFGAWLLGGALLLLGYEASREACPGSATPLRSLRIRACRSVSGGRDSREGPPQAGSSIRW
jgi:hypothetical protein